MSIVRVHYRERQRLTTADLRAEQDFRLGLAGRHHLTHHQCGVVRGLRVVANNHGGFTLTPGVAIDGYGREILVSEPIDVVGIDPKNCSFVMLHYCEDHAQVPAGRQCEDEPAPRIAQRAKWTVADGFAAPVEIDTLDQARGGGAPAGLQPWPVLVARVGLDCNPQDPDGELEDYGVTRYVRHRASVVRSPTGRARLKLGLESRSDTYAVLLSALGDGQGMASRVGIDRDGVTHVWKPLVISGVKAVGQELLGEHYLLKASSVMPGGIGNRVRLSGLLDAATHSLSASMVEIGGVGSAAMPTLSAGLGKIKINRPLDVALDFGGRRLAALRLFDVVTARPVPLAVPRSGSKKRAPGVPAPPASLRFSMKLKPTGGVLAMRRLDERVEAAAVACGDVERSRPDGGVPDSPVFQLRPASEVVDDPRVREVYAVTTSQPSAPVPRTELRLSGGAEDKTDVSTRLSAGAWRPDAVDTTKKLWVSRLRMDGGRRIDILADTGATPGNAVSVKETVYLPAIGKDDPLLAEMMAMAFMAGLRQIGRLATGSTATLSIPATVTSIARGGTLSYELKIDGGPIRRCVETIRGVAGTGDLAFRTIPNPVVSGTPPTGTFTITLDHFRHSASRVGVQVVLLVTESNIPKLVVSNVLELPVTGS